MYISASIYSNKSDQLQQLVASLDESQVDYFHIDSKDDASVFEDIINIRKWSSTPIDIHFITSNPERYFEEIQQHHIEQVCFQLEDLKRDITIPQGLAPQVGLAICSGTDYRLLEKYSDGLQYILVMTTTPGESGGVFKKENFEYIRKISNHFPHLKIQVDGGVNHEVSFILRLLGVDGIVSGNYLVNHSNHGIAMMQLQSKNVPSHFKISDFMIPFDELPILQFDEANLETILKKNEAYKMGCTFVVKDNRLLGISTNADVRRGLLKNIANLNNCAVLDLLNTHPFCIDETKSIKEMLSLIKSVNFPVLLLPVTDQHGALKGTVLFNNLIKSE